MDRYAVIGWPIQHSLSPYIHTQFAAQTGQQLEYTALLGEPGQFAAQVQAFRVAGGRGMNITLPYKSQAFALADTLSHRACQAGAANTLIFDANGRIEADNTDGVGLLRDLARLALRVTGQRVLILGAGGATAGILAPLLAEHPQQIHIANRTPEKAEALATAMRHLGKVTGSGLTALAGMQFDLILHATAAGLQANLPPLPDGLFAEGGAAYDLYYSAQVTPFLRWAAHQGTMHHADGLGMLVEQAAEAFYRWRGVRPEVAPVLASLRSRLTA
jgi:shikimate dehydrogenase